MIDIDINELRKLTQAALIAPDGLSAEWMDRLGQFQEAASPDVISELLDRLEAAEKERDALRDEIACVKEVEFPRKVQAVADAWKGKCERLEAERDALRAKIEAMERQEPVAEWIENKFDQYPQLIWDEKYKAVVGTKLYALPGAKGEEK